jgi:pimeloyl-ACP methyl ester carboxylesterase
MTLRRIAPLVVVLLACQAELDRRPLRAVEYAVFDPSQSLIPLPNDLALASAPTLPPGAQKELLLAFAQAGGFPNDQEVPLTIDFTRAEVDPDSGEIGYAAPDVELASVSSSTLLVVKIEGTGVLPVAMDYANAQYVKGATRGTLTLRRMPNAGKRSWDPGAQYAVAVRGGPHGVSITGGHPAGLQAQPTFYVLRESALGGKPLTDKHNQGLLPGTDEEKAAAGARLEPIRQTYAPALQLLDGAGIFPASDVALLQTFKIEAGTNVPVDAGTATLPLPIDLLRDPTTGKIVNNPAFGPAAAGLATLDGFSTTAMILAPTSGPIDAGTVRGNVALYKLNGAAAPTKVLELVEAVSTAGAPRYVAEPTPITQACPGVGSGSCSTVIGLAPAVPAAVPGVGTFAIPPLDEATEYAVVVTNGVKDVTGAALKRSTFAKILLTLQSLPVNEQGKSQLVGVSDATAGQIALMKGKLAPVMGSFTADERAKVVMAWTFRTQSITGTSLQLSASVYQPTVNPAIVATAPATDPLLGAPFLSTKIVSLDAIDPANGALNPNNATWAPKQLDALVALPPAAALTEACPQDPTLKCAPLVVFHHGLNGGRWQAAALANTLLSNGYALAAIDAPYHGARAFCAQNSDCVAADGTSDGVCTPDAARAGQGDDVPPGTCTGGSTLRFDDARKTTVASGNYFVSENFFRIRDGIRQDLIDESALVLALARPPSVPLPAGVTNPFADALKASGIGIHPAKIYYVGQSLGGIVGTNILATNPRFSRGVLNVAGGTLVDVFTQGDAFADEVDALFLGLGIDRKNPAHASQYLKTLNVAKWILDPADPINFAKHLVAAPLPNLLANPNGSVAQAAKDVLGQAVNGDPVVENPFNLNLYENAGIDWTMYVDADAPLDKIHGFLSSSPEAQSDVVGWLNDLTYPGATITLP